MRRWIATVTETTPMFSLIEEQEFIGSAEITEVLFQFGWVKPYDDIDPKPPKGMAIYEPNKQYENDRIVLNGNAFYLSNVGNGNKTSASWVPSEWVLKLQGII